MKHGSLSLVMDDYQLKKGTRDVQRDRDHRSRYKNVDLTLLNTEKKKSESYYTQEGTWNNRDLIKAAKPQNYLHSRNGGSKIVIPRSQHYHGLPVSEWRRKTMNNPTSHEDAIHEVHDNQYYDGICSSGEEDAYDEGIMYSYDKATGPSYGADYLSQAVSQAVMKFETKQFETLVKNEYDIVDFAEDSYLSDDEFEFV